MSVQNFTKSDFSKKYIQNGFSFMPGGFLIYRADDTEEILYANPSLLEIFECETEEQFIELTGGSFKGVVYSEDLKNVESSINLQHKLDKNVYDNAHYRIMTRSGKLKYVQDFGKLCIDEDEGPLFYVFISFLKIKLDPLTGLPLRWYFIELVKQGSYKIIEEGGKPVIIAFDFTGMKTFNNRYGVEEGDNHLANFSHILKKHFGGENCSRFGEDHFYAFCDSKNVEEILNNIIIDLNVSESNSRNLPLRMGIAEFDPDISIDVLCNRAKTAADTLKGTQESDYVWFNEKMSKLLWKKDYIISHIHQAINERWVEPYYQPVVRTLNGRLCNLEALARWRDPELGVISPSDFIPILEENGLSYKLDMYIVERVLTMLQHRLKEGLPVVPISVNISRSDFDYCDPVKIISSACDVHGVKRGLIAVEITESSLMSDQDVIRHAIDRFHAAGFEVWMDDFGSGYSSLNVLKDFDFDEIKIDMAFLRDFNERSRKIVTMAVKMAKALGIHTLAEGVETEEHIDFLKSIGCERIQGYYYGKPDAITEQLDHLKRTGINFETLETASFYQKTGLIDFDSKRPLALFFFDGKRFTTIFRNNKYIEEIAHANIGDEVTFEFYMNQMNSVLGRKFRALAEKTINSGNREVMTFVVNNQYFRFMFAPVASSRQGNMLSATIDGSIYEDQQASRQLDIVMRNIMAVYESIYLIDFKEDSRTVIVSNLPNENEGDVIYGLKNFYEKYNVRYIHVDDLERFRKVIKREYIEEMFKLNGRGSFSELFPIKKDNGSYEWTSFLIIAVPETNGEKLLACIKPSLLEDQKDKKLLVDRLVNLNNLLSDSKTSSAVDFWNSAVFESDIKFFWKDKDRRFLGASRAFLDYYGMRNSKTIIGKTDEEIGWHIDDSAFRNDELEVLEKGSIVRNSVGKNIINGLPHDIQATKFPIYHDGKIVGLMGYFFDSEIDGKRVFEVEKRDYKDSLTGFLNFQGMFLCISEFDNNFRKNAEDYSFILLRITGFENLETSQDDTLTNQLILKIAELIKESFGSQATIARSSRANFSLIIRKAEKVIVDQMAKDFERKITEFAKNEYSTCNLKVECGIARGSEKDTVLKVIDLAYKRKRILKNEEEEDNKWLLEEKDILLDVYNDIPIPLVVVKIVLDEKNSEPIDIRYLFVNQKYCELSVHSRDSLVGKNYYSVFPRNDKKWIDDIYRATKGEYVFGKLYSGELHHWVKFTASPASFPGTCSVAFDVIDDEREKYRENLVGRSTTEAILFLTQIFINEKDFKIAINKALLELGGFLNADRVYVFETDRRIFTSTFEWCREGVTPEADNRQNLSYRYIAGWERLFEQENCVSFADVSLLRFEYPTAYNYFKSRCIDRFLAMPLFFNGKLIGYAGADNYSTNASVDVQKLMQAAAHMISTSLILQKNEEDGRILAQSRAAAIKAIKIDGICMKVAGLLASSGNYKTIMNEALKTIGEAVNCDRVFIMSISGETISNTFEWCNAGVEEVIDKWQNLPLNDYLKNFTASPENWISSVVDDIELYNSDTPERYDLLKISNVNRVIETPIFMNGKLAGFLGVDNYDTSNTVDTRKLLEISARHIGYRKELQFLREKVHGKDFIERLRKTADELRKLSVTEPDFLNRSELLKLESYRKLPIPYAVVKLIFDSETHRPVDFEYVFVNEGYCNFLKKTKDELEGKRYYDIFLNPDPQWIVDFYAVIEQKKQVHENKYHDMLGCWIESFLTPLDVYGYCSITLVNIDSVHKELSMHESQKAIGKTIIRIAKKFVLKQDKDVTINSSLKELSSVIQAEHIYILSLDEKTFSSKYEWNLSGIPSCREKFQNVARTYLRALKYNNLPDGHEKDFVFESLETIKNSDYELYEFIIKTGIRNIAQVPLFKDDVMVGYIGACNFAEKHEKEIKKILSEVSVFFASQM